MNGEMLYYVLDDSYKLERSRRTKEGWLEVWGTAAVEGTMDYPDKGLKAYVGADELAQSAAGLVGRPVTCEHPAKFLDAKNFRDYAQGSVVESWFDVSAKSLRVRLTVYDADLIDDIEKKRRNELSPGYHAYFVDTNLSRDAKAAGANAEQRKRVYNHLAVTKAARGGRQVRLMDSCIASTDPMDGLETPGQAPAPSTPAPTADQMPVVPPPAAGTPPPAPAPAQPAQPGAQPSAASRIEQKLDQLITIMMANQPTPKPEGPKPEGGNADPKPPNQGQGQDSMNYAEVLRRHNVAKSVATARKLEVVDTAAETGEVVPYERAIVEAVLGADAAKGVVDSALPAVLLGLAAANPTPAQPKPSTPASSLVANFNARGQDSADALPPLRVWGESFSR